MPEMAICAVCGESLTDDGLWYMHQDGSIYGGDGHAVTPITRAAYEARKRE